VANSGQETSKVSEKTSKTADQITILIDSLHPTDLMVLLKLHLHGKQILSMQIDAMLSSSFPPRYSTLVPSFKLGDLTFETTKVKSMFNEINQKGYNNIII